MRYAAFVGDELVALLGWTTGVLHNKPRDDHLGWDAATRVAHLYLVANNVRFLVLPWAHKPHLASRVLAANLRRLSRDWQAAYGHRVLLAETFVDATQFRGTCYRASNWIELGNTSGFSRRGAKYWRNDRPKRVFIYPLHPRAQQWLCAADLAPQVVEGQKMVWGTLEVERLPMNGEGGLFEVLKQIVDPRKRRGKRYKLHALLAVAACATLCGARSLVAMEQWAAEQADETLRRLGCRRAPSEKTFRRIFSLIDMQEFDRHIGDWARKHGLSNAAALALDGKTLRGSGDGEKPPVHLLGMVSHDPTLVVAQQEVPDKSNEITGAKTLLKKTPIEGATVTGDAMFTQKEIATLIKSKGAEFVFTVKDNQPTLRADIEALHLEAFPPSAHHRRQGPRPH